MKRGLIFLLLVLGITTCKRPSDYLYAPQTDPAKQVQPPREIHQKLNTADAAVSGHVDFIWVVGGMAEQQQEFYDGGADFMKDFATKAGLSWRMAVLSSDERQSPEIGMNPLFTDQSLNPVAVFSHAISHVLQNYDNENIFDPVVNFIQQNPSFLRPEATLAIIISNDAPTRSVNTADTFLAFLKNAKQDLSAVSIHGIFAADDLSCLGHDGSWYFHGSAYEQVIKATGGKFYPLCGHTFGTSLAQIGNDVIQQIPGPLKLRLPTRPKLDTLKVSYHGQVLPGGPQASGGVWYFDFNENAVGFYNRDFMNGTNDPVDVSYKDLL